MFGDARDDTLSHLAKPLTIGNKKLKFLDRSTKVVLLFFFCLYGCTCPWDWDLMKDKNNMRERKKENNFACNWVDNATRVRIHARSVTFFCCSLSLFCIDFGKHLFFGSCPLKISTRDEGNWPYWLRICYFYSPKTNPAKPQKRVHFYDRILSCRVQRMYGRLPSP
jgi:hypothetical protein